jgi:hypothetical protein
MAHKFKKLRKQPATQEFWYDISLGGYLKPEQFSSDPATIKAIKDAVALLQKLENMCDVQ